MTRDAWTLRVYPLLPLFVASLLFAFVSEAWLLFAIVLVLGGLSVWVAPGIEATRIAQGATLVIVAVGAVLATSSLVPEAHAGGAVRSAHVRAIVAVSCLLLALGRRFFRAADGGEKPDFALLAVAIVASGGRRVGPLFLVAVVAFVLASALVWRSRSPRLPWSVVERPKLRDLGALVLLTALASAMGLTILPRLARLTQTRLEQFVLPKAKARAGFADGVQTGAAPDVLHSNAIVLRVTGPHVDYLRGRVYDTYQREAWVDSSGQQRVLVVTPADLPRGPADPTELRPATSAPGQEVHYFLPSGAHRVSTRTGTALADAFGTLQLPPDEAKEPVTFEAGLADEAEFPVAAPRAEDLAVPEALRPTLEGIATEWTREAPTARAKLAEIERRLSHEFTYSVAPDPAHRESDILYFLRRSQKGHCEHFATAMALLGRALNIPTRVVGGFRVAEHNDLGGYDVVREQNAHAWVEAFVEGEGWRTFDPTPPTEANLPSHRRSAAALLDVIAALWDRALDRLGQATLLQFALLLGPLLLLFAAVRRLRRRRERRAEQAERKGGDEARAGYVELESSLAARGYGRAASEPLERYAGRLEAAELVTAAGLVLDYAALRYGGIGDATSLDGRLRACVAELEAPRSA